MSYLGKFGHAPGFAGYYIWALERILQGRFTKSRIEYSISLLNMAFSALSGLFAGNFNPYHRAAALIQRLGIIKRPNPL